MESGAPVPAPEPAPAPAPAPGGRGRTVRRWTLAALALTAIVLASIPFSHPIFPVYEQATCTVTSPSERHGGPRRGVDLFPHIGTDCGTFTAQEEVVCTADPTRMVQLIPGVTVDLTVQGPRIPVISSPTVVSAQVSTVQTLQREPWPEVDADSPHADALAELRENSSPEHYRAWDYEQPPYDRACDAYRTVMTSDGPQVMSITTADEMLAVPAGTIPRDPLLPCEYYSCDSP